MEVHGVASNHGGSGSMDLSPLFKLVGMLTGHRYLGYGRMAAAVFTARDLSTVCQARGGDTGHEDWRL